MTAPTLETLFAPIADDLRELEDVLEMEAAAPDPLLQTLVQHVVRNPGKRLRPSLVFLCARAAGGVTADHMRLACVVELLHAATLVHDDILDHAATRRGRPSVPARWDSEIAVIFGDYLFSVSFGLIAEFAEPRIVRELASSTRAMCEGEMLQLQDRFHRQIPSTAEYLRMIELKTATLLSACARLSVFLADRGRDDEAWGRFGHQFGMAFQIVDDCLDLRGEERQTGKSLGTDLTTGKATLPFLEILDRLPPPERARMLEAFWDGDLPNDRKRDRILSAPCAGEAFEACDRRARAYLDAARAFLRSQPPSPAREALEGMAEHLRVRRR